jgi:F-box-like
MITYLCVLGEISPIKALPDEILLTIFDFCRVAAVKRTYRWGARPWPWMWRNLVHVCQRWRYVVFSSPLRLDLRIYYSDRHGSSLREILDVWPPFLIEISCHDLQDNLIAALEHRDRICELRFELSSSEWWKLAKVTRMQKPFPALTCLRLQLGVSFGPEPALSQTFLGGSAPSLRSLYLDRIPFPTLPQLLLSCKDLSELYLKDIPNPGYISPDAMATALSGLTKLTCLEIWFEEAGEIRLAPPSTRAVLPALTVFKFCGFNQYLKDLLSRIDLPQLETLSIIYREDERNPVDISQDIPDSLPLAPFHRAEVIFCWFNIVIRLYQSEATYSPKTLKLDFMQSLFGYQPASIARICTLSPLLSSVTELDIGSDDSFSLLDDKELEDLKDNSEWLALFRLCTSIRTLRLSSDIQPFVVSFIISSLLGHTEKSFTDVLPELQNLYVFTQRRLEDLQLEEQAIELLITTGHTAIIHRLPDRGFHDID